MPSQRIFLDRHRSQACAIRLCELVPTLITFIGRMPGMVAFGAAQRVHTVAPFLLLVAGPRESDRRSGRARHCSWGDREEARRLSRCCRVIQESEFRRKLCLPGMYAGAGHTKKGCGLGVFAQQQSRQKKAR